LGYPVDVVNRMISPAMEAVGMEPSARPFGGSAHLTELYTGGETPLVGVGAQAISNFPASAAQFGEDIITPITQPVETAKAVGNLLLGIAQKAIPGTQSSEATADAVGQFFMDRYGGMEEIKQTMANDPVGFMADLSAVLTAGTTAAGRLPGAAGQTARAATSGARALDPLAMTGAAMRPVATRAAGPAAAYVGDILTHTGGRSLEEAASAGYQGGRVGEAFRGAITGATPMENVVSEANRALQNIRQGRSGMYTQGMGEVIQDKTVLNFDRIDDALSSAVEIKRFEGVPIGRATAVTDEITEAVNQWKMLDPAVYHTAEGLDALKQKIGEIMKAQPFGSPDRASASLAYRAIRDEITQQAPSYAGVMKNYWEASDLIDEMEGTLSLNPRARIDTSLRKLQSLLRNNANTNYGRRVALGEMLQDAGADTLMAQLSGQALQPWAPRGLGRVVAGGTGAAGLVDPSLLALLPFQSPRVMGEAAYWGGRGARLAQDVADVTPPMLGPTMFQAGRLEDME
jgi:hypothetical protein